MLCHRGAGHPWATQEPVWLGSSIYPPKLLQAPKQGSLPVTHLPWLPAPGHHQCPPYDKCFPVETAASAL